ncbi:DUF2798 domain-containing protein [Dysgonomonas sp. ZJ709]|uniref:DUF2798 domain-containing protein n=1 Tax=Dysgonomonas sp. ZJ709 TaxID=2709797 RepID=UPI0013EC9EA4|nr:DUF2798 domain-containing protein [Dysgonomonas sp. ZJ709]
MNRKYSKYIKMLFVVAPMTFFMTLVAIIRNNGFECGWVTTFAKTWWMMLPVAYILAFVILPIARKMTDKIVR